MYVGGYKKVVKMHRGENPIVTLWYKKTGACGRTDTPVSGAILVGFFCMLCEICKCFERGLKKCDGLLKKSLR